MVYMIGYVDIILNQSITPTADHLESFLIPTRFQSSELSWTKQTLPPLPVLPHCYSALGSRSNKRRKDFEKGEYTPKIEHGTLKRKDFGRCLFLFKWVIFRFQPLVFQGVPARTWVFWNLIKGPARCCKIDMVLMGFDRVSACSRQPKVFWCVPFLF